MRKLFLFVLCSFLCVSASFAVNRESGIKSVDKDIAENGYTLLARSITWSVFTLAANKDGTLVLYYDDTDVIKVYTESSSSPVTKEYVAEQIKSADEADKIIEANGYTVYTVVPVEYYHSFITVQTTGARKFYVKTPKGVFYPVSKKIKSINPLIDEL